MISNKLCNPTGVDVRIPYEKGVVIVVPADGYFALTVPQMDDYRPDKPGSEETRKILYEQGVFLEDPEVDYNRQALQSIRLAIKAKTSRYEEAKQNLVDQHMSANMDASPENPQFQQKLQRLGLGRLLKDVDALKKREVLYLAEVGEIAGGNQILAPKFDPTRTTYATDPPREFASKLAMDIFLSEHPDIASKHLALSAAETEAVESDPDADLNY